MLFWLEVKAEGVNSLVRCWVALAMSFSVVQGALGDAVEFDLTEYMMCLKNPACQNNK